MNTVVFCPRDNLENCTAAIACDANCTVNGTLYLTSPDHDGDGGLGEVFAVAFVPQLVSFLIALALKKPLRTCVAVTDVVGGLIDMTFSWVNFGILMFLSYHRQGFCPLPYECSEEADSANWRNLFQQTLEPRYAGAALIFVGVFDVFLVKTCLFLALSYLAGAHDDDGDGVQQKRRYALQFFMTLSGLGFASMYPIAGDVINVCATHLQCIAGMENVYALPFLSIMFTLLYTLVLACLTRGVAIIIVAYVLVTVIFWLPALFILCVGGKESLDEWKQALGLNDSDDDHRGRVYTFFAIAFSTSGVLSTVQVVSNVGLTVYLGQLRVDFSDVIGIFHLKNVTPFDSRVVIMLRIALLFTKLCFYSLLVLAWLKPDLKCSRRRCRVGSSSSIELDIAAASGSPATSE
jgi:hypothetical protein